MTGMGARWHPWAPVPAHLPRVWRLRNGRRCSPPRPPSLSSAGPLGLTESAGGRWGSLGPRILPKLLCSLLLLSGSSVALHLAPKEVQWLGYQGTPGRVGGVRPPEAWAGEERAPVRRLEKAEVSHQ